MFDPVRLNIHQRNEISLFDLILRRYLRNNMSWCYFSI